jgi:hypothetical protein
MRTEYDIDQTEAIGKVLAELAFNLNEFPQDYSEHLRAFASAAFLIERVDDWEACQPAFDAEIRRLGRSTRSVDGLPA